MRLHVHCTVRNLAPVVCVLLVCSVYVLDLGGQSLQVPDPSPAATMIQAGGTAAAPAAPLNRSQVLKARLEQLYATADFNGDGLQDVALVEFLTDSIKVMTAEPGGTFRNSSTVAARRGPRSIVAADLNGDRVPDLAVAGFLSGDVSVYRGEGNGQFDAPRVVRVGEGVNSLVAQDLTGDGRTDIVVANALSGAVLLLKNAGTGSFERPAEIGRPGAVTLLSVDVDDDGVQDVAALNAEGTAARVVAASGTARLADAAPLDAARVLSAASAEMARTTPSAGSLRLGKMAGDGVAQKAGTITAEPLVVEVTDSDGTPVADGQVVVFSRIAGSAESAEPGAVAGRIEDVRATDELGRASMTLTVPNLPDVSVIAAALPADQVVHFAMLSVLTDQDLATAIETALALEVSDDIEIAARIAVLRQASQLLRDGDVVGAVRSLRTLLDALPSERSGAADPAGQGRAADLSRRFINQVLLTGVTPAVAENEPLTCGVPLTRTIAVATETDRFTFACKAGELVHVRLVNQGGTAGFNPQWRLLTSAGTPAAVCGTLSSGDRDCTLAAAGIYSIEVNDAGFNATGTYNLTVSGPGCTTINQVTVTAVDATAVEAGRDPAAFRISRAGSRTAALTVNYTIGGSAIAGTDHSTRSGSAVIPAGSSFTNVSIVPVSDLVREVDETVILTLTASATYAVGTPRVATVTITEGSDLIISAVTAPVGANPGQTINVTVGTRNQGTRATVPTTTQIWLSANTALDAGDTPLKSYVVPGLGPGITHTLTTAVTIPVATARSSRFLIAEADSLKVQVEANERNNTRSRAINIGPDYVVTALSTVPGSIPAGSAFTINDTTRNNGGPVTIATTTRFYLSLDSEFSPTTDVFLAQRVVPPLSAGQSSAGSTPALMPDVTTVGARHIIAVADALNQVAEVSETNNARAVAITVLHPILLPDVPRTGNVNPAGEFDLYTLVLDTRDKVVLQATNASTFAINPCFEVTTTAGLPVSGGQPACGGFFARLDIELPAGTYFVRVFDQGNNNIGPYNLLYERIRRVDATPLIVDRPPAASITPIGDLDLYWFTLDTRDRVVLQASNTTAFAINPCFEILTAAGLAVPGGRPVCGGFFSRLDLVLPAGTYFVLVYDQGNNNIGPYSLLYQRIRAQDAVQLFPDLAVAQDISPVGDLDLYRFTLDTTDRVVLQASNTGTFAINPCFEILPAVDQPAVPLGRPVCGGFFSRLDLVLQPGTYFVLVYDQGNNNTGPYTLLYQRIRAADAKPLLPDVPVNETIAPVGDLDLYTFTLDTSDRVVLQASNTTAFAINPCFEILTDVRQAPVAGPQPTCGGFFSRVDRVLPAGTYFVLVYDQGNNNTGPYTLLYQRIRAQEAPVLSDGVPVSDAVSPIGELDLFRFTLTTSERVVLQMTNTATFAINPCFEILTAVDQPPLPPAQQPTCGGFSSRLDRVLPAGTYFVLAYDQGNNNSGPYTLLYQRIRAAGAILLAPDAPLNGRIEPPGNVDLYRFTLNTSDRVVLQVSNTTTFAINPCFEILTAVTELAPPPQRKAPCGGFSARLDLPTLAAGTYYVLVYDQGHNNIGPYTLLYQRFLAQGVAAAVADAPAAQISTPIGDLGHSAVRAEN